MGEHSNAPRAFECSTNSSDSHLGFNSKNPFFGMCESGETLLIRYLGFSKYK